jgi:hypothetical protein
VAQSNYRRPAIVPDTIFTVGHGRERFEAIAALLDAVGVGTLIDVRSAPYSRNAPDFSRPWPTVNMVSGTMAGLL